MIYTLISGQEDIDGITVSSFGVAWTGGKIERVTPDQERLADFVDRCNRCGIDPSFLVEVLTDFLE